MYMYDYTHQDRDLYIINNGLPQFQMEICMRDESIYYIYIYKRSQLDSINNLSRLLSGFIIDTNELTILFKK